MKIALCSDIHANLPALEAFLEHVDQQNIDAIYCLGDLVGYNIWPNEVIEAIRKRNIPTIAGNYDYGIGRHSDDCGCAYKTEEEKANGAISISLTNELVSEENRSYLRTLPAHIRLEFQLIDTPFTILLVHGSPRKINEYLFEDRAEKSMLRILEQSQADVLCFGHTHQPYHRVFSTTSEGKERFYHAINIGSVGKPKDRDTRGGYVLLTLNETTSIYDKESMAVDFIRFDYDIEKAAKAVEESILPNHYAENLRRGY